MSVEVSCSCGAPNNSALGFTANLIPSRRSLLVSHGAPSCLRHYSHSFPIRAPLFPAKYSSGGIICESRARGFRRAAAGHYYYDVGRRVAVAGEVTLRPQAFRWLANAQIQTSYATSIQFAGKCGSPSPATDLPGQRFRRALACETQFCPSE